MYVACIYLFIFMYRMYIHICYVPVTSSNVRELCRERARAGGGVQSVKKYKHTGVHCNCVYTVYRGN